MEISIQRRDGRERRGSTEKCKRKNTRCRRSKIPSLPFSPESASAPHRRPPSSAVSALVLSLTSPLLCADLRVSASPRQNHTRGFPIPFHHGPLRSIVPCACLCVSASLR